MFGKGFRICKILGIDIEFNSSAIILIGIILWIMGGNWLPMLIPNQPSNLYWLFGLLILPIVVMSLLAHELSHSLVARRFGLSTKKITLFAIGAIAHLEKEPESAKSEFWMAVAGPFTSIVLGIIFFVLANLIKTDILLITASLLCLSMLNFVLATFNLLPAFPMDGGRIFRSFLWWILKDQLKATKIAARIGQGFGGLMIFAGVYFWQPVPIVVGVFLFFAAGMSYRGLAVKKVLDRLKADQIKARDIMDDISEAFKPVDIEREAICGSDDSLATVLEKMASRKYSLIFVVENNEAIGMISREGIQEYIKSKEKEYLESLKKKKKKK